MGPRLDVDQPRLLEDAEVFRDLRLIELQPAADVVDRRRPGAEQLDDAEAVGFGEGGERLEHGCEYATTGIFLSRHIKCAVIQLSLGYHRGVLPSALAAALRGVPALPIGLDDPARQQHFVESASAHRVRPLLAWALRRSGELHRWPTAIRERLIEAARAEAVLEIARRHELCRLMPAFDAAGIGVLAIKGAALAYEVYPEPWLRPREDTDLLVRPTDAARAGDVLTASGYRAVARQSGRVVTNQQLYVRSEAGHRDAVDLHWKIADPATFADLLSAEDLFRDAVVVTLDDACVVRVPCRRHALLLACWHRAAHHHDVERLLWLYDIHLIADALNPADSRIVAEIAGRTKTSSVCASALTLAVDPFRSPAGAALRAQLGPSAIDSGASLYVRRDARLVDLLLADLRALPTWTARMRLVREHLFPPAEYMRATYGRASPAMLPALYAWRVAAGVRRWFQRPDRPENHGAGNGRA